MNRAVDHGFIVERVTVSVFQERLLFHLSRPDDWRANGKKVRPIINRPAPPKPLEFLAPSVTL